MNYFVEGLQESGKSKLVKKLYDIHPEYRAFHEGDYSPVELAWCAYVSGDEYENIDGYVQCFQVGLDPFIFLSFHICVAHDREIERFNPVTG